MRKELAFGIWGDELLIESRRDEEPKMQIILEYLKFRRKFRMVRA